MNMQYEDFIGAHEGESVIIMGCGTSLKDFVPDGQSVLFGVNDTGRKIASKYLMVLNEPFTFRWNRWSYIEGTDSIVFTHLKELPIKNQSNLVKISVGKYGGCDIESRNIDFSCNSPYMACIIAHQMGFRKIGLIGVDFTPDHFFINSGGHPLSKRNESIVKEYEALASKLVVAGRILANLSPVSIIPWGVKCDLEEFNRL